jgi:hypothetical protein
MKITISNKIGRAIMLVALLLLTTHLQAQNQIHIIINGTDITVNEYDGGDIQIVPIYSPLITITVNSAGVDLSGFDWVFMDEGTGDPVLNVDGDPWDEDDPNNVWTGTAPISDVSLYLGGTYTIGCINEGNPGDPNDDVVYAVMFTIAQPLKLPINHRLSPKDTGGNTK